MSKSLQDQVIVQVGEGESCPTQLMQYADVVIDASGTVQKHRFTQPGSRPTKAELGVARSVMEWMDELSSKRPEPVSGEAGKELPDPVITDRGSSRSPEERISRDGAKQAVNSAWASTSGRYTQLAAKDKFDMLSVEAFFGVTMGPVDWEAASRVGTRVRDQMEPQLRNHDSGIKVAAIVGFIIGWTALNNVQQEFPLRMLERFTEAELELVEEAIGTVVDEELYSEHSKRGKRLKLLAGKVHQVRHEYDPRMAEAERSSANLTGEVEQIWPEFVPADYVMIGGKKYKRVMMIEHLPQESIEVAYRPCGEEE